MFLANLTKVHLFRGSFFRRYLHTVFVKLHVKTLLLNFFMNYKTMLHQVSDA